MNVELMKRLESILFASGSGVKLTSLAKMVRLGQNLDLVEEALRDLEKKYSDESPLILLQEGDTWKLTVREKYVSLVKGIAHKTELSKTMMETLAVIAYRAPVLQSDVIKIRTNKAYDHLIAIESAGYISRIKHGKTKMIRLTPKFFEYFDVPPDQLKAKFKGVAELEKQIVEHETIRDEKLSEQERLEKAKHLAEQEHAARIDSEIKSLDQNIQQKEPEVKRLLGEQLEVFNQPPAPEVEIIQDATDPSIEIIRDTVGELNVVSIPETEKEKKQRLKKAKMGEPIGKLGDLEVVKMPHPFHAVREQSESDDSDISLDMRDLSSVSVEPETPQEEVPIIPPLVKEPKEKKEKKSKIPKIGGLSGKSPEFRDKVSARADALMTELQSPASEDGEEERTLSPGLDEESENSQNKE